MAKFSLVANTCSCLGSDAEMPKANKGRINETRKEQEGIASGMQELERGCYLHASLRLILRHLERDLHSERTSLAGMEYDLTKETKSISHPKFVSVCLS